MIECILIYYLPTALLHVSNPFWEILLRGINSLKTQWWAGMAYFRQSNLGCCSSYLALLAQGKYSSGSLEQPTESRRQAEAETSAWSCYLLDLFSLMPSGEPKHARQKYPTVRWLEHGDAHIRYTSSRRTKSCSTQADWSLEGCISTGSGSHYKLSLSRRD